VPTLFLVSVIVFALMRLMPGDVATRMVEGHGYAKTLDALRHDLGLDPHRLALVDRHWLMRRQKKC
jgi:peptide/nickel transport system permease protein